MKSFSKINQETLAWIGFLALVPILAHFSISSLGFNPTDDGFILAYTRRLLEGQIPHRDFISIRPVLSPLLHIPFVLGGGDYTYWISRFFVWFQLVCIAWNWTFVIERLLEYSFSLMEKASITVISIVVSTNNGPILAWHTVDALFLISIGLALSVARKPIKKMIGYLLMSTAYLCKQNFIFVAPLILIAMGDWRKTRYWLMILIPGALYVIFLWLASALPPALSQLSSQHDIFSLGVRNYRNLEVIVGIAVGYLSIRLATGKPRIAYPLDKGAREWLGFLMLFVLPLLGIATTFVMGKFMDRPSFYLFGLVLGVTGYFFIEETERRADQIRIGLAALITSWCASLSIGVPSPIIASGPLLTLLFANLYPTIHRRLNRVARTALLVVFAAIALSSFAVARVNFIYRDRAAPELSKALDGLLPGGKWIKTNVNTYQFLVDLQGAIRVALDSSKTYAIIPDCAGYWVKAPCANPLPIDWPQHIELNKQELVNLVTQKLDAMRDTNIVIVQNVDAGTLAEGFESPIDRNAVVEHVRCNFKRVYQTHLFDLYK